MQEINNEVYIEPSQIKLLKKSKLRISIFFTISLILFFISLLFLSALKSRTQTQSNNNAIQNIEVNNYNIDINTTDPSIIIETPQEGLNSTISIIDTVSQDKSVIYFITSVSNYAVFSSMTDNNTEVGQDITLYTKKYGNSDFYYISIKIYDDLYVLFSGINKNTIENIMCGTEIYIDGNKYNFATNLGTVVENMNNANTNNSTENIEE